MASPNLHSFLRHTLPGYIFLLASLTYSSVLFPRYWSALKQLKEWDGALLLTLAGIPVGIVIHWLYRGLYYDKFEERYFLQRHQAHTIRRYLCDGRIDHKNRKDARMLTVTLLYWTQNQQEKQALRDWMFFASSQMHALGSGALAIGLGLIIPSVIFVGQLGLPKREILSSWGVGLTIVFWLLVLLACLRYRREEKATIKLTLDLLVNHYFAQRNSLTEASQTVNNLLTLREDRRQDSSSFLGGRERIRSTFRWATTWLRCR
jgi:hypothetical protein